MTGPASGGPDATVVDSIRASVEAELARRPASRLLVALSGGLDSTVLLHALRFGLGRTVSGAHFDHRMRPGSGADAAWIRGLCRAWGVPFVEGSVPADVEPPSSENEARTLRYAFLRDTATDLDVILTAHHADDQAETVLFRILRGTGIEGLAGIPARRPRTAPADGEPANRVLLRPLLGVWREELEAYAARHGLGWRDDPTNDLLDYARNVLRHEILPTAEQEVAAGARRSLVRLASIAADERSAWDAAMPIVLHHVRASDGGGEDPTDGCSTPVPVDRGALLDLGPELAGRVLRHLAARHGVVLDHATTRRAVGFVRDSQGGRHIELGGGVELALRGHRVVVRS